MPERQRGRDGFGGASARPVSGGRGSGEVRAAARGRFCLGPAPRARSLRDQSRRGAEGLGCQAGGRLAERHAGRTVREDEMAGHGADRVPRDDQALGSMGRVTRPHILPPPEGLRATIARHSRTTVCHHAAMICGSIDRICNIL